MSNRFRGIAAGIMAVFFGSSYSIFSKYLMQWTIPETLLLVSQGFTIVAILLFFGLLPELRGVRKLNKRKVIALIGVAFFSSVLGPLLYLKGLSETSTINAIVTSRLSSIFVGVLGFLRLKEAFTWKRLCGTLCMFGGILYITTEGFDLGIVVDRGVMLVMLYAISSAIGALIYKKHLYDTKREVVIFMRYLLAFVVFLIAVPWLLNIHHEMAVGFQPETWVYFTGLALIPIVLATYLWYESLDHLPASTAGAIDLLGPFSGMLLAYVFLHEELHSYHLRGSLLIIIGLLINLSKKSLLTTTTLKRRGFTSRHHS